MARKNFSIRQMSRIVLSLGWTDFSLKYRGSIFGYLWSFLSPLTRFLVILFVFRPFVGFDIPSYPLYLFLGIILWEHFSGLTSACLATPFDKAFLIQYVRFPRILLLLAAAWSHVLIFLTYLVVFLFVALWSGTPIIRHAAYIPILLLQMTPLALGIGGILGAFVLRYRDLRHLWEVLLTVLFWLTPIMYPYRIEAPTLKEFLLLPEKLHPLTLHGILSAFVRFQPLSIMLYDARRALLYGESPSFFHIAVFLLFCVMIGGIGCVLFHRRSRVFLEEY